MTRVWRYKAIPLHGAEGNGAATIAPAARHGELPGESAAEVRAALRRLGLQVIDLKPLRGAADELASGGIARALQSPFSKDLIARFRQYLRRRRQSRRAELYDGVATMLASGLPLLEAVDTAIDSSRSKRAGLLNMLLDLREELRGGASLAAAMERHPGWFGPVDVAMVSAAQHSGTLPAVLRRLAERTERSGELSAKLAGALAYPAIVAVVGIGVTVFLSVKTLPDLTSILIAAKVDPPQLTQTVMAIGGFVARYWIVVALTILLVVAAAMFMPTSLRERLPTLRPGGRRLIVGGLAKQLAELLASGVPMVDALRVLAPTTDARLRKALEGTATRLERGESVASAFDDDRWFDAEFQRMVELGEASGELDQLLDRLGDRYERQAKRFIDRLASLLEPAVILALAALVGTVVMAAVLPLLKLQEVV